MASLVPIETRLFGVRLFATDMGGACTRILDLARQRSGGSVCVANVDMLTRALSSSKLAATMQSASLVVSDGVPLVWALRKMRGLTGAQRVYGPELMATLCERAAEQDLPVFLYGGTSDELSHLKARLLARSPDLEIAGAVSPPMLPSDPPLDPSVVQRINESKAAIVFVALGCPKQEMWIANHAPHLNAVCIGVGLAFAQLAGTKHAAPEWMKRNGLEWLYRLMQEPSRLWKRYFIGNSLFVWCVARELLGKRDWSNRSN